MRMFLKAENGKEIKFPKALEKIPVLVVPWFYLVKTIVDPSSVLGNKLNHFWKPLKSVTVCLRCNKS